MALEKKLGACEVKDFRPITILSLVYRTWSSLSSREALRFISTLAPDMIFGNLPGATASSLCFRVQTLVEQAGYGGQQQLGFSADLVKAFNHLPRIPVLAAARVIGLDRCLLEAWAGALHGLERRFRIRSSTGPAIRSVTGFAEGCGKSCVAMAITNLALHAHIQDKVPQAKLATYEDNWEGIAPDPKSLAASHSALKEFAGAWDLLLDESKTLAWISDPRLRKELRERGFLVTLVEPLRQERGFTLVEPLRQELRMSPALFGQQVSCLATAT